MKMGQYKWHKMYKILNLLLFKKNKETIKTLLIKRGKIIVIIKNIQMTLHYSWLKI